MLTSILVPQLDLGVTELRIGVWHIRDERPVREGDRLVEIIAGEVVVELSAPAEGILRKRVSEDEIVAIGQIVGEIEWHDKLNV